MIVRDGEYEMTGEIVERYTELHRKVWQDSRQGKDSR
jgi:hypothetical protein